MLDLLTTNFFAMFSLTVATVYTLHYLFNAVAVPRLYGPSSGRFRDFIRENVPAIRETYWPSFWCFHSHLLTPISNAFRQMAPELKFHRELLTTSDGGTISIDWFDPESQGAGLLTRADPTQPIALFIPGLTGTSSAEYLRLLIPISSRIGYRPVVVNYRGLGDTPLTSPRLYCAANHEDLELALRHIRKLSPNAKLIATALSMGGTVLAGYLTKVGFDSLIDAATLISVCWDFNKGAKQLVTGYLNPIVNRLLTKLLVTAALKHRATFENRFELDRFHEFTSLRQFDHHFTIRIFGYSSTDEYYRAASYADRVDEVKIPTFSIQAADDMLSPEPDLPLKQVEGSSHVAMLVTARGGHIGFMEGMAPKRKPNFYLERVFEQWMGAVFQLKGNVRELCE